MNVLVTGGTGFIGSALVRSLVRSEAHVSVLSLPGTEHMLFRSSLVRFIPGSVTDATSVRAAMEGCQQVYHLAALACPWRPKADEYFRVNCGGTSTVMSAARDAHVQRVLHVSSNVVFGPSDEGPVDESTPRLCDYDTAYERSKVAAERVAQQYVRDGLDVVIVSPTRVFGPGPLTESNAVTQMIAWYLDGTWRWILGPGTAIGNYVYLPDLINGMRQVMQSGRAGENYLLGGENISFNDLFVRLAEVSGVHRRMVHLPKSAAMAFAHLEGFLADRFGWPPLITCDWTRTFLRTWPNSTAKAQREVGYRPTELGEALQQTVQWLRMSQSRQHRAVDAAVAHA